MEEKKLDLPEEAGCEDVTPAQLDEIRQDAENYIRLAQSQQ